MGKMIIFYPPSLSTEETLACAHHQTGSYSVRQHTDRIKVGIIAIHNELLIVKQTVCVGYSSCEFKWNYQSFRLPGEAQPLLCSRQFFFSLSPFLISSLNLNLITNLPTQDKHTPKHKQPVVVRIRV